MVLEQLSDNLNIIQELEDSPSLSASELKAKFDESGGIIKKYINEILLPGIQKGVEEDIKKMTEKLTEQYPVGSIFLSINNVDPSTLFSGTKWTKIKDVFLLCSGDKYKLGTQGGEEKVTLDINTLPKHNHSMENGRYTLQFTGNAIANGWEVAGGQITATGGKTTNMTATTKTVDNGLGKPHNNMPPYLVVNAWYRVS